MVRQVIKCESGRTLTFRVINPRLIIVTPLDISSEIYGDEGIVGLNYGNELSVSKEEVLTIKKYKYKPHKFKRVDVSDNLEYGAGYYIYTSILNLSTRFIMPLLGGDKFKFYNDKYLMNCFVGFKDKDVGKYIYLWYRYVPEIEMEEFENFIFNHPSYDSHTDVDKFHVLYKMKVPEAYKKDYNLILEGKYSKIHIDTKTQILEFHNTSADRPLGQVLFRSIERRKNLEKELGVVLDEDAELFDKFNMVKEVFDTSYVIEGDDVFKNHKNEKV